MYKVNEKIGIPTSMLITSKIIKLDKFKRHYLIYLYINQFNQLGVG